MKYCFTIPGEIKNEPAQAGSFKSKYFEEFR